MNLLRRTFLMLLCCTSVFVWWQCSSNQTSITGDIYHNTTAHFNGYFYAHEKVLEVEKAIMKSLDDDPNQILRLYPKLDTVLAKSYKKDTEEIIKMASISIQRHPNSKWLDDDYLMVGLARLYDCDFANAVQTFKYVNTKSQDPDLRHKALVHLIRTFTEQNEFDKAEEAFQFLEKEKLSRTNAKSLYLEKAYYYQIRVDYDNMVRNLTRADSLLTKADRKGRIYFIIGQVYQKLGFAYEAYNYYRKCLGTNPDYEIDFYARLNMAQVANLNSKNIKIIRKQFEQMLTDTKNNEFKDKIYFELGEFERKQGNVPEAIEQYKLSAHAGSNKRIQGTAYLRVGQLYFDSLKRFSLAKSYYDSAMSNLPKEFENYDELRKRHEVLGEFVKYTETITWQDSLLKMAAMDSSVLRAKIDSTFEAKEKLAASKKKKKNRSGGGGNANQNSAFFQTESTGTDEWYFGNPSAVASGQSEFQRIWGNIPLEDNWRRSTKSGAAIGNVPADDVTAKNNPAEQATPGAAAPKPSVEAANKIFSQLPKSEKAKNASLAKIEEAYFKLGDLYYFKLAEKDNAEDSYEKLLERFPQSAFKPEVLYKLYLIHKERGDDKAEALAQNLKQDFPNSEFTKILLNPDYLKETAEAEDKQKLIYKEAYAEFQKNNLRGAQEKIKVAKAVGETSFTPQLDLLQILITGKTEDVTKYQYELGEFIKAYPDATQKEYAEKLLASSKTFIEKAERSKGIRFVASFEEPHYFVAVYKIQDRMSTPVSTALENFNNTFYKSRKLETTNLIFNDEFAMTFVGNLADKADALEYFNRFNAQMGAERPFSTLNFYNFVITRDNFNIYYRYKALDEYLSFFDRYYQKQNQ
ncbi:MAG TPA: tetratricopeptide repeat protein [Cyclobacteriaceae bacterium]|nr:tetratricopeptide repeat protein [Cyclobacteriaceae bacterium]